MEIALVLAILVGAVILFISEKYSVDLVAFMVAGSLLLFGLVTPQEGISGFSNQATVTVAAMFVLSAGLQKTGAVAAVGVRRRVSYFLHSSCLLIYFYFLISSASSFPPLPYFRYFLRWTNLLVPRTVLPRLTTRMYAPFRSKCAPHVAKPFASADVENTH
jgi:di/tricarboxylate transporter